MQSAVQLHNTYKTIYSMIITPKIRKNNIKVIKRSLKPYSKTEAKLCIKGRHLNYYLLKVFSARVFKSHLIHKCCIKMCHTRFDVYGKTHQ